MPAYLKALLLIIGVSHFSSIAKEIDLAEGLNPGNLSAQLINVSYHNNGIIVMLPGCGQSAKDFAKAGGFVEFAQENNLTILAIQQKKENNIQACFNWFSDADSKKGNGEYQSIVNFIDEVKSDKPVYLIGLSAGGAMASALVLQQPGYFKGVAIVAGIPYPCANNIVQAISCMKNGPNQQGNDLANSIKAQVKPASTSWPEMVIITGTNDPIVNAVNSERMANQYVALVGATPIENKKSLKELNQSVWTFSNNKKVVLIKYDGLGHGLPVAKPAVDSMEPSQFYMPSAKGTAEVLMDLWF